jgi:hypothetical protein
MSEAKRAVCIGEAIVELARGADGRVARAAAIPSTPQSIWRARARPPASPAL